MNIYELNEEEKVPVIKVARNGGTAINAFTNSEKEA